MLPEQPHNVKLSKFSGGGSAQRHPIKGAARQLVKNLLRNLKTPPYAHSGYAPIDNVALHRKLLQKTISITEQTY